MQTKRLRKKTVSVDGMDVNESKPWMIDHLCVSRPSLFRRPLTERESEEEAEYVEAGSVAMRSGTVQHSRMHPSYGLGFGPEESNDPVGMKALETFSLPNRPLKDKTNIHKKAKQHSSELAEPRRLPTASFGFVRKQETESNTTQVVDSHPGSGECVAFTQRTRETERKLNPFVEDGEASTTPEARDCTQRHSASYSNAWFGFA